MLKLVQILLIASMICLAVGAVCHNERGPKLCNRDLLTKILDVCESLENANLLADETLPRCCCSFGCSDVYLRKTLCPDIF